jgi:hypothetical protein
MHAPERVLGAGQGLGLLGLAKKIVLLDRDAEAGVGLAPDDWIGPVVALVGRCDEREPAVVRQGALEQLDRIVVVLEADVFAWCRDGRFAVRKKVSLPGREGIPVAIRRYG